MTDNTHVSTTDRLRPDTVKPIVRESIVILGLIAFIVLGSILPGTGHEIPGTAVSIGDLVVGLGSLGIVGSLIYAGPKLREVVVTNLEGPESAVKDAASIVRNTAVFAAVLVAHWGFAPVLLPLLERPLAYDIGFLLLALVPLGVIAYRLYHSLDPLAAFLTGELLGEHPVGPADSTVGSEDRA